MLATLAIGALTTSARAEPVPMGFRGDGSGVFSGVTPPLHWGPTTNIKWKAPLPALASSSPVVAGGRVFVTAEPATVLCFDAEDGHLLW